MPEKARSQYRVNEDNDYRIQNTAVLKRSISKESDHIDESDSSESSSEVSSANKSNSFPMSEILVISKHQDSMSGPKSGRGDATDKILREGSVMNEDDGSRDDTYITEARVEWTRAKQALVDLINERLRRNPVLRARAIAELDAIDSPEDFVAILEHPLSKCDILAELPTKSECQKRRSTWISRGVNETVYESDESNSSSDESESDSEFSKNVGKEIQSIVQEAKTSNKTENISPGSSTALASGPKSGNAKGLQNVLMGMKELSIVPMNDLDGKNNVALNIATPVIKKNLSVRNEFDDVSSEDEDDDDDDDNNWSSAISIDANVSDESDDENYTTRGVRGGAKPAPYSTNKPVSRGSNALLNHEYKSSNVKTVNQTTWNVPEQTKLYVLPGLVTPPSSAGDVNYQQGAFIPQTNSGPSPTQPSYPYSPASLSGDYSDPDAYQSVSNNSFIQNDGSCLDLHPELQDFYTSDYVPACQESEISQDAASFSQSESVWSPDNFCGPITDCSTETNTSEHDDNADQSNIQSIIMEALKKLNLKQQRTLMRQYLHDESARRQLLKELKTSRGNITASKASRQKAHDLKDLPRQLNRNPLTVKKIIDEKLQISIDPKLMNKMKADKLLAKMARVFELDDQEFMPANNETVLMRLLRESENLSNNIELFVVLIERMTRIPWSFNNRDEQNRTALHLAATNFPTMPEIVGHLAKIMLEGNAQSETITQLNETIIGVLSKGDTHIKVLEELLNVERSGEKIFDVNSYISLEGKTMLEIAYGVNTNHAGSADRTIELLKRNACPTIGDYNALLDNGISRQGNDIRSDSVDFRPRVTAEYIRYTSDTFGRMMVSDQFQNRQTVM